jgi:hypothetical protein
MAGKETLRVIDYSYGEDILVYFYIDFSDQGLMLEIGGAYKEDIEKEFKYEKFKVNEKHVFIHFFDRNDYQEFSREMNNWRKEPDNSNVRIDEISLNNRSTIDFLKTKIFRAILK